MGDPAGIGPELALRPGCARDADSTRRSLRSPTRARSSAPRAPARPRRAVVEVAPDEAAAAFARALPVVPLAARADARPGAPDRRLRRRRCSNRSSAQSATSRPAKRAPSSPTRSPRATLYAAGFRYPGHTEFLGELARAPGAARAQPVMMIWSPALAVVPGHHPCRAGRGPAPADARADRLDRAHRRPPTCATASASHGRASPSPASIRTPAKAARWGARKSTSSRRRSRDLRAEGLDVAGPAARRHDVPRRGARALRRRAVACITTRR